MDTDKKEIIDAKVEKLKNSKFKQQNLNSWRSDPSNSFQIQILLFSCFGMIFIMVGCIMYVKSDEIFEISIQYDKLCKDKGTLPIYDKEKDMMIPNPKKCVLDLIDLEGYDEIPGALYIYYGLDNFHQNDRRFYNSRSIFQLNGNYIDLFQTNALQLGGSSIENCNPIVLMKDLNKNQQVLANGTRASDKGFENILNMVAMPCGLGAKWAFNDTFQLQKVDKSNGKIENVVQRDNDISWYMDDSNTQNLKDGTKLTKAIKDISKYGQKENDEDYTWKDFQWQDMEDPHFLIWMRTASLPKFRKIYATIDTLETNTKYQVEIQNNYDVTAWDGSKTFIITNYNKISGGKNYFLAVSFMFFGTLLFVLAGIFTLGLVVSIKHSSNEEIFQSESDKEETEKLATEITIKDKEQRGTSFQKLLTFAENKNLIKARVSQKKKHRSSSSMD